MLTAARSLRKAVLAEPLPSVPALYRLSNDGISVRRGELVMIAGMPNSGKSAFILWWLKELGVDSLCFSADNSVHTTLTRLLSTVLQVDKRDIIADLDDNTIGPVMTEQYMDLLKDTHIQFCFDGSLSLRDIQLELDAYVEVYDKWPEVIVVDNLINVEDTRDHEGQSGILSELHFLARTTGACVFILHHCSEANQTGKGGPPDPRKAPPRSAIQNKVTQYPDLILTVAVDSMSGAFEVAAVKVRGDKTDPNAVRPYLMYADLAKTTFYADNPNAYQNWTPSGFATEEEEENRDWRDRY